MWQNRFWIRSILWLCGAAAFIGYVRLVVDLLNFAPINPDAGCYLPIIRDMAEGVVMYRDIKVHYTPLGIYLLAWGGALFGGGAPAYEAYLWTVLLFEICACAIVYLILRELRLPAALSMLGAVPLGYFFLLYQGGFIEVEAFTVCFALCSLLVALKRPTCVVGAAGAGFTAGLSFLCKQYGLGAIAAPLAVFFLCSRERRTRLRLLGVFALFWCLPVVLTGLYFCALLGTPWPVLLENLRRRDLAFLLNEPHNLVQWMLEWSAGLLMVAYALTKPSIRANKTFWILCVGALAFCPQFFVRQSGHYFMLVVPFLLLLVLAAHRALRETSPCRVWYVLGVLLCAVFVCLGFEVYFGVRGYAQGSVRTQQYARARVLALILPQGRRAVVFADPMYQYLNNIKPYAPHDFSYDDYPGLHPVREVERMLELGRTAVLDRRDGLFWDSVEKKFERAGRSLDAALREKGFIRAAALSAEGLEVWEKPGN